MTVNGREAISAAQVSNGAVGSRGIAEIYVDTARMTKNASFLLSSSLSSSLSLHRHLRSSPRASPPPSPFDPVAPQPRHLPPPHPLQPRSLFLANLKFVRRLRLLDGWPLIFCELHLAQTSPRPPCILLTAALVAGPRHLSQPRPPNASSLQEPRHQLNPPPPRRLRACKHT